MDKGHQEKLLPGFPREGKLQTMEEVDAYFASDKIQCLLCGKWFKDLGCKHLISKHEITADEYREMYGLPWARGLTGSLFHEKKIELGKKLWADGKMSDAIVEYQRTEFSPPRPRQPYARVSTKRCRRKDFEAILERMRNQQRTLGDVCKDPDMPTRTTWYRYVKRHPDLKEKAREILYDLPYSLQAGAKDLSPRFSVDCQHMRSKGMTVKKIAADLGVSTLAVSRALHKSPGGFRNLSGKKFREKWRREDYEAVLDRMRKQKRTLFDVLKDPDLPPGYCWSNFIKKHPEFVEKLKQTCYSLPYSIQVRCHITSPQFGIECQRLRDRGMSVAKIVDALGVTSGAVKRTLRANPAVLFPLAKGVFVRYRRKDYEAILDRMRNQMRLLADVCGDPDMPSKYAWSQYTKRHPEFEERLQQTYYSLPYSLQFKSGCVSPHWTQRPEDAKKSDHRVPAI